MIAARVTGYALGWLRDTAREAAAVYAEAGTRPGEWAEAACLRLLADGTTAGGTVRLPADREILTACARAATERCNTEDGEALHWQQEREPDLARMARAGRDGFSHLSAQLWRAAYSLPEPR